MDNLSRCAMAAKVKGMSYGKWQALYGKQVLPKKKEQKKDQPEKWQICPWCGKEFKRLHASKQIYCQPYCQSEASKQRARDRKEAAKNKG